jgi:hypothetical protein
MKTLRLLAAAALAFAAFSTVAFADSTVSIPVGDWAAGLATALSSLVTIAVPLIITSIVHRYVGAYVSAENIRRLEQLLVPAIQTGLNKTAQGIPHDVRISVSNPVAAHALEYALTHGPGWLIKWAGGSTMLLEKIEARLKEVLPADMPPTA